MDNKFEKSDRLLNQAFVIIDVITFLIALCTIIGGIGITINGANSKSALLITLGVITITLITPISAFVFYVLQKVMLYMYCDIKLIRNKLYNQDNNYLKGLINYEPNAQYSADDQSVEAQSVSPKCDNSNRNTILSNAARLKELKSLLDDGILTQEEFNTEKKNLLNHD